MRIVLDTNVILAAFTSRGLSQAVFEHCLEEHDLVLSEDILQEFAAGLRRKFKMPPRLIDSHLDFLRRAGRFESPLPVDPAVCRDPGDLHILGLALQARAGVIVSGDKDLLNLGSFRGIPILSPRAFWEREHLSRRRIQSRRASYGRKSRQSSA